jgi:hypothetical protein
MDMLGYDSKLNAKQKRLKMCMSKQFHCARWQTFEESAHSYSNMKVGFWVT